MVHHVRILAGKLDARAGSHVYHRELIRRLAARGHRISVICFEAAPEVLGCAEVFVVPRRPPSGPLVWRLASWLEHRHCTRRLAALDLPPADVVIGGEHLFLTGHRRRFPQTPWVYLPHSLVIAHEIDSYGLPPGMRWATKRLYVALQRRALAQADRTLRFSRQACDALARHYGPAVRPRFVVNPTPVDLPPEGARATGEEVRLLSVGRLTAPKNLGLVLRSLHGLGHLSWRLDVVGDGDERAALEALAARLGIAGRVSFHGQQDDPAPWYRRADLFVFASKLENSPLVVLEAMSHGVPCLWVRPDGATYRSAAGAMIEHGTTGLLAGGEADFARLLREALGRPDALPPLGRAARRQVAARHTWDRHLDTYESLFDELIGARNRRSQPTHA